MGCLHVWVGVVLVHGVGGGGVNRVYYVCKCHTHHDSSYNFVTLRHYTVLLLHYMCCHLPNSVVTTPATSYPCNTPTLGIPPPMTVCAEYMQDP